MGERRLGRAPAAEADGAPAARARPRPQAGILQGEVTNLMVMDQWQASLMRTLAGLQLRESAGARAAVEEGFELRGLDAGAAGGGGAEEAGGGGGGEGGGEGEEEEGGGGGGGGGGGKAGAAAGGGGGKKKKAKKRRR